MKDKVFYSVEYITLVNCRSTVALKTGNFVTCFLNRVIMMMIVIKMTIKVSEHCFKLPVL